MAERWLPVVGFEGLYEVSDQGRVRSLERQVDVPSHIKRRRVPGKVLSPGIDLKGYPFVTLFIDAKRTLKKVARAVLEAFVGPCPDGHETLHGDGDPSNSQLGNLRWGTKRENAADKDRHGTSLRGERSPNAKLTESDVLAIRAVYAAGGVTLAALGEKYNVHYNAIGHIVRRTNWSHV